MERMTRAAAARELGIDKSTLTRWVQKHPALVGNDGMVDLIELREHRDTVANPKLQTRGSNGAQAGQRSGGGGPGLNDHRARGEAAKAITAELDLAERLKMTLVRADVESQIGQAGEVLRRKAAELIKDRAEAFARIDDPRAMERALDELFRRIMEKGAQALILAIGSETAAEDEINAA